MFNAIWVKCERPLVNQEVRSFDLPCAVCDPAKRGPFNSLYDRPYKMGAVPAAVCYSPFGLTARSMPGLYGFRDGA